MSYIQRVLADVPYAIWSVDSSTFTDSGGSQRNAELTTPANYRSSNPLISGTGKSVIVGDNTAAKFFFPGFKPGYERRAFSLEVWFSSIDDTDDVGILSHDGDLDGLWFDGQAVHFTTVYSDASTVDTSYVLPDNEAYHVVGVHNESRNSLYVNGVLVDQSDVSLEQFTMSYASITNEDYLYAGQSAGASLSSMDAPAVYAYALQPRKIFTHFMWGREHRLMDSIVTESQGYYFDFTDTHAAIYISKTWNTVSDWNEGLTPGITVADEAIRPDLDSNGNAVEGQWLGSVNLSTLDALHEIESARLYWDGSGDFTVYVALDGATFNQVNNGELIAGITPGYLTQGKTVDIMIEFGPDEDAIVESLSFVSYLTDEVKDNASIRLGNFSGNIILSAETHQPIENNATRGAQFFGGVVDIQEDVTEDPQNISTLELWVKFDDLSAAMTILDYRTGATTGAPRLLWSGSAIDSTGFDDVYVNGSASLPTFEVGVWYHFVLSLDAAVNIDLRVGQSYLDTNPLQGYIGHLAFFPSSMVVLDALELYASYFGINLNQINDENVFTIAEDSPAYNIYTYDWSITSAG